MVEEASNPLRSLLETPEDAERDRLVNESEQADQFALSEPIGTTGLATYTADGSVSPIVLTVSLLCACNGAEDEAGEPYKVCADCLPQVIGVGHTITWAKPD